MSYVGLCRFECHFVSIRGGLLSNFYVKSYVDLCVGLYFELNSKDSDLIKIIFSGLNSRVPVTNELENFHNGFEGVAVMKEPRG